MIRMVFTDCEDTDCSATCLDDSDTNDTDTDDKPEDTSDPDSGESDVIECSEATISNEITGSYNGNDYVFNAAVWCGTRVLVK